MKKKKRKKSLESLEKQFKKLKRIAEREKKEKELKRKIKELKYRKYIKASEKVRRGIGRLKSGTQSAIRKMQEMEQRNLEKTKQARRKYPQETYAMRLSKILS